MAGEAVVNLVYDAGRDLMNEWVDAQINAENAATERMCEQAIGLTPPSRWAHLELVYRNDDPIGCRTPPSVACSWPELVAGSAMAVRARFAAGEA